MGRQRSTKGNEIPESRPKAIYADERGYAEGGVRRPAKKGEGVETPGSGQGRRTEGMGGTLTASLPGGPIALRSGGETREGEPKGKDRGKVERRGGYVGVPRGHASAG